MNSLSNTVRLKPRGRLIGGMAAIYKDDQGNLDISAITAIKLCFDDGEDLVIECGKDGESIVMSPAGEIAELRMGEWGDFIVESIEKIPLLCAQIGMSVLDTVAVEDVYRRQMGVRFRFSGEDDIYVLNLGDNISVCEALPGDCLVAQE